MKLTALVAAAAAFSAGVHAQNDFNGLLSTLQREIERSSELLEQLWDSAFSPDETSSEEEEVVRVVVIDVEDTSQKPLTVDEQQLACRVAVQRVQEQAVLRQEAERLSANLRSQQLVSVHFTDEASCDDLPKPQMVRECERVLTMDADIQAMLHEKYSPEEICEEIVQPSVEQPPLSCKLCRRFVQMVVQAIAQDMVHVQQLREILGDICDSMSADSMCHSFLKQYDDVVSWLKHGTDPELVCERLNMCTQEKAEPKGVVAPAKTVVAPGHGCMYCEHIAGVVAFVQQHAPDKMDCVHKLLKLACRLAPKDCKCGDMEKNFAKIVDMTKQGQSPEAICKAIGICKGNAVVGGKLHKFLTNGKTIENVAAVMIKDVGDAETCLYCQVFTTLVETAMHLGPDNMSAIRMYADLICGMLGDNNMCHKYVDKLDFVMDALHEGKKAGEICTEMKYCEKKTVVSEMAIAKPQGPHGCMYCEHIAGVVAFVQQHDPDSMRLVHNLLWLACKLAPKDCKCDDIEKNFDKMVDLTKQGQSPEAICKTIGICKGHLVGGKLQKLLTNSKTIENVAALTKNVYDDKTCFYCDYFTTLLEIAIQEDPDDMSAIRMYADMICGMLGDNKLCHKYVDKLDYAIDALAKGEKPRQICTEMKFCEKKNVLPAPIDTSALLAHAMDKSVRVGKIDDCFFCTQLGNIFKVAVAQDESQIDTIRTIADLICNALPAENKCHKIMKEVDTLIDSIKRGEEPEAICRDLHYCVKHEYPPIPLPKKAAGNDCAYCDGIVIVLEYALKMKPDQVQQFRELAGMVCDIMPADDLCHDDLKKFDKAVVDLKAGKSAHEICQEFDLCPKATPSKSNLSPLAAAKLEQLTSKATELSRQDKHEEKALSMSCLLCEYTAEALVYIGSNTDELHLAKQSLETMCFILPPSARCDVLSAKFDDLEKFVRSGKSPRAACEAITLCGAGMKKREEFTSVIAVE